VDGERFDDALRNVTLAMSRRGVTRALGGLGLSGFLAALLGGDETEAAKTKACKRCKQKKTSKARKKCEKKKCEKKKKKGSTPRCGSDLIACGGNCVPHCPQLTALNPVTCQCCVASGLSCGPIATTAPCCSGGDSVCVANICQGIATGQPCQFTAQCQPGINCVNGVCTA
jgi:hypothetical protein